MFLPQDGFDRCFCFRDVLHDDAVIVQRVACGIIQPQAPEDQGGEHQDEQDREHQQGGKSSQYLPDDFPVFP